MNRNSLTLTVLIMMATITAATAGDWFAFAPPKDDFNKDAMLDLRTVIKGRAGSEGPLIVRDGKYFTEKTGREVRFLSVNAPNPWGKGAWEDSAARQYLAKRLGKMGANNIRIGPVRGTHKMTDAHLDGMQELIARCADEGIYSSITFFFPLEVRVNGLEGYGKKKSVQSLVFFHPVVRAAYEGWLKTIMTTPNPHANGVPLAKDPAVAMVELVNEDNLFFFTFSPSKMPSPARTILYKQFGDWLKKKYGSLDKAMAVWGGNATRKGDNPAKGLMEVYDSFMYMPADWAAQQRNAKRSIDNLTFIVELQRNFYADMTKKLRSWGYKSGVIGTNWKTTNEPMLGALEKYANMTGDTMDRHAYFSGSHKSARGRGWVVGKGDMYADRTQLKTPDMLELGVQYKGYPQFISEHYYPAPNRYRAEMVWIGAHYGAMLGIDGFSINEFHTPDWIRKPKKKFDAYSPVALGQFPAAAFVYRFGGIEEAKPVFTVTRTPEQLYKLEGAPVWDSMKIDSMRAGEVLADTDGSKRGMDPLAWFVGPVEIAVADSPASIKRVDVSKFVDPEKKVVKSATSQLRWDYGKGVVTANAPRAQTACGFLADAGRIELKDVVIEMKNDYGTVWLVSMDGKPIASSSKLLLQVMTEQRVSGWKVQPTTFKPKKKKETIKGWKILNDGKGPIEIRNIEATVGLKRADASRMTVTALDHNGYKKETLSGGAKSIKLKPDVLWYIIQK